MYIKSKDSKSSKTPHIVYGNAILHINDDVIILINILLYYIYNIFSEIRTIITINTSERHLY